VLARGGLELPHGYAHGHAGGAQLQRFAARRWIDVQNQVSTLSGAATATRRPQGKPLQLAWLVFFDWTDDDVDGLIRVLAQLEAALSGRPEHAAHRS
jgi:hypothetical protein